MVTSVGGLLVRLVAALSLFQYVQAKTVTYDFNVTWVTANPDGLYDRKVVGINNQWPLPVIEVLGLSLLESLLHGGVSYL